MDAATPSTVKPVKLYPASIAVREITTWFPGAITFVVEAGVIVPWLAVAVIIADVG